jgi:DUF4097 and DUF4098 domain-containing protein YvlB
MNMHCAVPRVWKSAGLLVPGFLLFSVVPAAAQRLEKHFKVEARPVVTIHNPNGAITVKAWTRSEVLVIANLGSGHVDLDAQQNGNRVDVMTRQLTDSVSPEDLRADYQINVPQDAELQIHDDSGAVSIANVLGDMNVETIAADVDLQDAAGYLTIATVGGSFQCMRCAGRIEVNSISGSFRLMDTRSYHVRAQTSTGNILFSGEFLPNGQYRLKNYSGVIELRFLAGDSFDVSATSLKGKVNNQAKLTPPNHAYQSTSKYGQALVGSFNTAGHAQVDLTSFDGTINIVKRD